jgi:four helix bundle protein
MSRHPQRLEVFALADDLVVGAYRATSGFPVTERFGLQSQIRRGAVSVPANLVEGCARRSERDYVHFIGIALGSASEVRYLVGLAGRLGFVSEAESKRLNDGYSRVIRAVQALVSSLTCPKPEARSH